MADIKQIVSFHLKALRIAGFLEYLQQVAKLVKDYRDSGEEGQSQLPAKVEAVYTPFVSGVTAVDNAYKLSRASEYTRKIAEEDDRRDGLYTLLVKQLKMFMKFTFDAERKTAAEYLWNIIRKYNVNIDENYSEESSKLQQMLQELSTDAQAGQHLTLLGLDSLITQLNTANEAVRTLMGQRNDERMQIEKAALATARAEADQAYRDLILSLNASAVMDENPTRFDELFSQVNELIKYYRLYVVPKGGKKDEEGGSSTGNESGSETGGNGSSSGSSSGSGQTGGDAPTPNPQPNPGGNSGGDDDEPDQ